MTPYEEVQPTHLLTRSNGMRARLLRYRARPPIYMGTIYDENDAAIRKLWIHCNLQDSKLTVEECIAELAEEAQPSHNQSAQASTNPRFYAVT